MKITFTKEILQKAVQMAEAIISAKTTMSILSNILIETIGDKVRVVATDLETAIVVMVNAEIHEEGSITVFAKKLSEIVRTLPNDDIDLNVSDSKSVSVKSRNEQVKAIFNIMAISKSEYPKNPRDGKS